MDVLAAFSVWDSETNEYGDSKVVWYANTDRQGTFGTEQVITTEADGALSVLATDIDGDGDNDVLTASRDDNKIAWHENTDGRGSFSKGHVISTDAIWARSVYAADLDGDGDMDVLYASSRDNKVAWYENLDGIGTFGEQRVVSSRASNATSVYLSDVDGDGDMDILFASWSKDKIAWYENTDGEGKFSEERVITTQAEWVLSVFAVDVDSDGDADVLSASSRDHKVAWYENVDGKGDFGEQRIIGLQSLGPISVHAADVDGDGDPDVLSDSSGFGGVVVWYENTDGRGTFGSRQTIAGQAAGAVLVFAADLDGDGDPDVLAAISQDDFDPPGQDHRIVWYENLSPKPNPGDANLDGRFDQLDIVHVLQSAKYLTGEAAVWEEGDWNGDSVFDESDIVAALEVGRYFRD